jgi:hypothetical protein
MATLPLHPILFAPASINCFAKLYVLIPPEALMLTEDGKCLRISCTASTVAPFSAYPVEVFTKSTPARAYNSQHLMIFRFSLKDLIQ